MVFDKENSELELDEFGRQQSQNDFYSQSDQIDKHEKEMESNIFSNNFKGNKLQLIENLEIWRNQEDEDSDTNIVNGFDDSLIQDNLNQNTETQSTKYKPFTSWGQNKSRNLKGLGKKFQSKGI